MKFKGSADFKRILWEVLELDPARRSEFLDNAGLNAEDRAEIESLLSFEAISADFMSLEITEFTKDFGSDETPDKSLIGQKIGIYEITGELGFGGMGVVYLAERCDGKFRQKAAIKMLRRELNFESVRNNFAREKEVLSKLDHPFIARLLDAGTTDDGVPFLVMEYVEGLPIEQFCEKTSLSLKERLKLFNRVCEAVSFAHRNLIIHRDLKPSNIIVTDNCEPKLLDFGISKFLDVEDNTMVTAFGAMTPEYASPEQIKGEIVSTATDIYSLSVVLYKMLTGGLPYELKGKSNADILKTITEEEPTLPSRSKQSAAVDESPDEPESFNNGQRFGLSKLKGDLDNIILKALSKEPERRYETVEQFSGDIWRHLDGLPVMARPATLSYRANKFFQRNRITVIAAGLIFLSLIAGIAVSWQQTAVAREAQRLSVIETDKAKAEQAKSEKITRFMSKIIGYANPNWYSEGAKYGKDARVIDATIDLSDRIDVEFSTEPDVAAELHHRFTEVIGTNAGSLGADEQKRRRLFHAQRALELRKQFYGEKHELVAKDMVYLYWARGFDDPNRASYLMTAMTMMRETNPNNLNYPYMLEDFTARLIMPEWQQLHEQYRNAVLPATNMNRYEIAEQMIRESLRVFRLHYKEGNSAIIAAECRLAYALAMQEDRKDIEEHLAVCKQYTTFVKDETGLKTIRPIIELIEKTLTETPNIR